MAQATLTRTAPLRSPRAEGLRSWWRWFYSHPRVLLSGGFIILLMLAAIFAPLITSEDPSFIRADMRLLPPGEGGWLGTDEFGRDLFARIIYGARLTLVVSFGSVARLSCRWAVAKPRTKTGSSAATSWTSGEPSLTTTRHRSSTPIRANDAATWR